MKESDTFSSAAGAVDISLFDFFQPWSQMAILDLAGLIMPLPASYKNPERAKETVQLYEETAAAHAANPLLQGRGLVFAARLMSYLVDETSPCTHRANLRARPGCEGLQMRLWHLTPKVVEIAAREMERADWWPSAITLPIAPLIDPSPPAASMPHVKEVRIDMARVRGIAPLDQRGMDRDTALDLLDYLRTALPAEDFPGVFTDYGCLDRLHKERGYYVEFWYADGEMLKLYSLANWEVVVAHADLLGTPDLIPRLTATCAGSQVA